jgi:protein tyrosine phosphatase (PTP) superfamily phosphohydrolase (DUF442 family)
MQTNGGSFVNFQNIAIQFAFLYAPFLHCVTEQVTPTLYRGPDPKIKDIYSLHDKGFKTIISLRTNSEEKKRKLCEKLGMKWIQIKTGVFLTPTDQQFDQFRAIINDPKNQPCLASCEIDMDRTGLYIATYRMVDQHWSAQQMEAEFKSHHQKKWWPPFRKYERAVVAYSGKRGQTADSANSMSSSTRVQTAVSANTMPSSANGQTAGSADTMSSSTHVQTAVSADTTSSSANGHTAVSADNMSSSAK